MFAVLSQTFSFHHDRGDKTCLHALFLFWINLFLTTSCDPLSYHLSALSSSTKNSFYFLNLNKVYSKNKYSIIPFKFILQYIIGFEPQDRNETTTL